MNKLYNRVPIARKYILYVILIFTFNSCQSQQKYDSELMTADIDSAGMVHGYNYTQLGCLLAYPWEYQGEISDTSSDRRKYSITTKISEQQKKELIFELQRDGSLKYWFRRDYIVNPIDTLILADGNKSVSKKIAKSDSLKIKHIYSTGNWQVNFKDSTIRILFGENEFKLNPIEGTYYLLDANEMCIEKVSTVNIIKEGEKKKMQVRVRSCFIH